MTLTFQIGNAIVTKLNGCSTLNGVYFGEVAIPTNGQYPFATVTLKKEVGKVGDTIRNLRSFSYEVNVYQERLHIGQGATGAENIVVPIIDEVLTAFDGDMTLSGMVNWVDPPDVDANYVARELGDTRIVKFDVTAYKLTPITS